MLFPNTIACASGNTMYYYSSPELPEMVHLKPCFISPILIPWAEWRYFCMNSLHMNSSLYCGQALGEFVLV